MNFKELEKFEHFVKLRCRFELEIAQAYSYEQLHNINQLKDQLKNCENNIEEIKNKVYLEDKKSYIV